MLPRQLTALALLAASLGCADELPIQYETEHLRIGTDLEYPLCRGDLLAYEQVIATVEDEFGIEMRRTATLYIWDDEDWWAGPVEHCPPEAWGCTYYNSTTIYTSSFSVEHELVHAVLGGLRAPDFFNEAVAEVYSGEQSRSGETAPSDNEGTNRETMDLRTGVHFAHWLRERWGADKLGQLLRTAKSPNNFDNFPDIYGMSIESAEQLYFQESPFGYSSIYQCQAPRIEPEGSRWIAEFELACATRDDTRVGGIGLITYRTFEIPSSGYYSVRTDGDWFDIYRCSPARIEEPVPPLAWLEDVPARHASFPSGMQVRYVGPTTHVLYFEAGVHHIGVGRTGYADARVKLAIWPSAGPRPASESP